MNSFLDSNVLIGYIFCLENLFDVSNKYIFKSDNNYFSKNVKTEVNHVFVRKISQYSIFLEKLNKKQYEFDDSYFMSRDTFHDYINNFDAIEKFNIQDMHFAFEKIWNLFDIGENQEIMILKMKFDKFINEFCGFNFKRKKELFNHLILIPNHTFKDKDVINGIEKENLRDELLHASDEEILFDAHEFAKNNKDLNLKFVTADQNFFEAITILKKYLCFGDCINLMEFSCN